jgi:hypothetical protein
MLLPSAGQKITVLLRLSSAPSSGEEYPDDPAVAQPRAYPGALQVAVARPIMTPALDDQSHRDGHGSPRRTFAA